MGYKKFKIFHNGLDCILKYIILLKIWYVRITCIQFNLKQIPDLFMRKFFINLMHSNRVPCRMNLKSLIYVNYSCYIQRYNQHTLDRFPTKNNFIMKQMAEAIAFFCVFHSPSPTNATILNSTPIKLVDRVHIFIPNYGDCISALDCTRYVAKTEKD